MSQLMRRPSLQHTVRYARERGLGRFFQVRSLEYSNTPVVQQFGYTYLPGQPLPYFTALLVKPCFQLSSLPVHVTPFSHGVGQDERLLRLLPEAVDLVLSVAVVDRVTPAELHIFIADGVYDVFQ